MTMNFEYHLNQSEKALKNLTRLVEKYIKNGYLKFPTAYTEKLMKETLEVSNDTLQSIDNAYAVVRMQNRGPCQICFGWCAC